MKMAGVGEAGRGGLSYLIVGVSVILDLANAAGRTGSEGVRAVMLGFASEARQHRS